jgi:Stress responsive A/B Barrel Domain
MVAHVVLFTPKLSTSAEDREAFVAALEAALRDIPSVVRATVGRRFEAGRPYDALTTTPYEYLAVLEFASRDDLNRYLDHPAHAALAQEFYDQLQVAAAYDFDVVDGADVRTLVQV